ncbi:TetR/AcrR family transcriptional regulator C-terminal domain-containing protein [Kitasatospora sp. NBC_00240]|uniref:TetR/AcrR family transcriptional regulator C-terminal domain-containing protein n=1 Tax=Kitasatospora sp. NBC_00240 TaxID=2903567 RepID=UPI0022502B90|nr:TetR/AcrR family transcriptional regulator C-terminal domain-containing protein [Kitasatospora sp. NBC_00240]MCX5214110.1 TetR/AcrR family transcriptional regulator C-terminal domain-containing protein [Kitasatospora sp. NBC_00240]
MTPETDPPFRRIAAELRRRITEGELAAGERVPSTRRIAEEWGVALATATKVLTTLSLEGLVESRPRVGTVVAPGVRTPGPVREQGRHRGQGRHPARTPGEPPARASRRTDHAPLPAPGPEQETGPESQPESDQELTRARIVRAAVEIVDAEGLTALSMRGVAARLGVAAMSPYRYVGSKEELLLLMADSAFGEAAYPATAPEGWRAQLELSARTLWSLFRRHPWLAQLGSLTRPLLLPNLMVHAEWALSALDGRGLDARTMLDVHVLVYGYVEGIAANLEREAQAEAASGLSEDEWMDRQAPAFRAITTSPRYPVFSRLVQSIEGGYDLDLDTLFEFGLRSLLDGLTDLVEGRTQPPAGA